MDERKETQEVSVRELVLQVLEAMADTDEKLAVQLSLARERVRVVILEQKLKDAEQPVDTD